MRRAHQLAIDDARKLGETASKVQGVVSTVKAIYPRKRRPGPESRK